MEFDRLAKRAAEGVRTAEPDALVYAINVVPGAPTQRIIYEIYRDRGAFESHEQHPHTQRFAKDRRSCVRAVNVIDLRLKYAKVATLGASAVSPGGGRTLGSGRAWAVGPPGTRAPRQTAGGTPPTERTPDKGSYTGTARSHAWDRLCWPVLAWPGTARGTHLERRSPIPLRRAGPGRAIKVFGTDLRRIRRDCLPGLHPRQRPRGRAPDRWGLLRERDASDSQPPMRDRLLDTPGHQGVGR